MRSSGILMPIFSLSSDYGIGTLGNEAFEFVDFLKEAGQSYWQILPINPTNYGDSPYQSFSSAAGNPYFIDLDILNKKGLLQKEDYVNTDFGNEENSINYGKLYDNRLSVLKKAFKRFDSKDKKYGEFCSAQAYWLDDYALFMAIKDSKNSVSWREWEKPLMLREPQILNKAREELTEQVAFYKFLQFEFYEQWNKLKKYANDNGIKIIGDMPIYVADDSADIWSDPKQFDLDEDLLPRVVSGCPPDAFSEDGQLWGSPVYNWEYMKSEKTPFSWWKNRMRHAFEVYDVVRIDHFRGFESFYCIKYGEKNAKGGEWRKGPGMELFHALAEDFGENMPIIAEDLGFLTEQVKKLLSDSGFPGMKVMQFAFDSREDSDYLPHNYDKNCVVYTGTHDNDTIIGWEKNAAQEDVEFAKEYMHQRDESLNWSMIRLAMMSSADTAIFMMPDFLGLDSAARINTPSTLGNNWKWRISKGCINDWLAGIIYDFTRLYSRLPKKETNEETN